MAHDGQLHCPPWPAAFIGCQALMLGELLQPPLERDGCWIYNTRETVIHGDICRRVNYAARVLPLYSYTDTLWLRVLQRRVLQLRVLPAATSTSATSAEHALPPTSSLPCSAGVRDQRRAAAVGGHHCTTVQGCIGRQADGRSIILALPPFLSAVQRHGQQASPTATATC